MSRQKTINEPIEIEGNGLFSGVPCKIRFVPAPADAGITFVRTDLPSPVRIAAKIANVSQRARRTSLASNTVGVETIEHVMAAVWGLGIDNLQIEMTADETPSPDGSPLPFVQVLLNSGLKEQEAEQAVFVVRQPTAVSEGDAMLAALPGPGDCLEILYDLDDPRIASIGRQVRGFRLDQDDFVTQVAPARTFLLEAEAKEQQARGLGKHLTPKDIVVMGPNGPVDNVLRFPDEHVRHKICDLIGDIALLGRRLRGRIVAYKSGHELNHALVRRLNDTLEAKGSMENPGGEPVMDVRKIMRLLKHRYPFLMVDRVLEIDGDRRIVGIKNVTINEPFFQGHFPYPSQPIMPAVLILEALGQISGLLLSRRLEHTGKVAFFVSMDRVRLRRPVRPGDQLILEAESLHVRSRTGHCRCRAYVGQDIAAEAEIKFMLVDDDPV